MNGGENTHHFPESDDQQQLRLLAILHYVLGALTAATFPVGLWVAWLGMPLLYPPADAPREQMPLDEASLLWGAQMIMGGVLFATICLVHGLVLIYLGRLLARRKRWLLVMIVSVLNLTFAPLGTIVSLMTLIVLARPSVKGQFKQSQ